MSVTSEWTVKELKAEAKRRGVVGFSAMKKAELISTLTRRVKSHRRKHRESKKSSKNKANKASKKSQKSLSERKESKEGSKKKDSVLVKTISPRLQRKIIRESERYTESLSESDVKWIDDYTSNGIHWALNAYLNGIEPNDPDPAAKMAELKEWADALNTILKCAPPAPKKLKVYRGVGYELSGKTFAALRKGDIYTAKGFTSTTVNPAVAFSGYVTQSVINPKYKGMPFREWQQLAPETREPYFVALEPPCCLTEIKIKAGTHIYYVPPDTAQFGEEEILLPSNGKFKFTGKKRVQRVKALDPTERPRPTQIYSFRYIASSV